MSPHDLYAVLGVRPDASSDEIQEAYTHKTQRAQVSLDDAFRVLSNPETRKAYDLGRSSSSQGKAAVDRAQMHPFSPSSRGLFDFFSLPSSATHHPSSDLDREWVSSPFTLLNRMASPFSDPFFSTPWGLTDGPTHRWINAPHDPWPLSDNENGRQHETNHQPSLWNRLFGPSASSDAGKSSSQATDSDDHHHVAFHSRMFSSHNDNGNVQIRAEEITPDGSKTVFKRGPDGDIVTVNGVPQEDHPWLTKLKSSPAPITETGDN